MTRTLSVLGVKKEDRLTGNATGNYGVCFLAVLGSVKLPPLIFPFRCFRFECMTSEISRNVSPDILQQVRVTPFAVS